jgi:glycerol-3-phosphate dehydrogenase
MDHMRDQFSDIATDKIDFLSRLYGLLLPDVMAEKPAALKALRDPLLAARVHFAVAHEMAVQLEDVVLRRLIEGQTGELSARQIETIAAYMADALGWTEAQTQRQLKTVQQAV